MFEDRHNETISLSIVHNLAGTSKPRRKNVPHACLNEYPAQTRRLDRRPYTAPADCIIIHNFHFLPWCCCSEHRQARDPIGRSTHYITVHLA